MLSLAVGTWPYSFDWVDLVRVLPEAFASGITTGVLAKNEKQAALAGAALGATTGALARGQIMIEMKAYPKEFEGGAISPYAPDVWQHNYFIMLLDALVSGGVGAGLGYLVKHFI